MEWTFGPAEPAFQMKDQHVDSQMRKATEPTRHKRTSEASSKARDEERVKFVAEAMYDYDQQMSGGGYETVEDYYDFAEVAIQAVKDFARQSQ